VTETTGAGGLTVTIVLPDLPSLVAVTVAVPAATASTMPAAETVATAVLLLAHVTTRPVTTTPFASLMVGTSVSTCPTVIAVAAGRVTLPTGTSVTVTEAVPDLPSLVAVIVALPAATPVTTPADETEATVASLVDQAITRPESAFPVASFGVAESVSVCPTVMLADAGATTTDATGVGFTITVAVPDLPSLVAVIVTVPAVTPVTRPVLEIVATASLLPDHVTTRPVVTAPVTSRTIAES
jgi:hypothetical protein